MLVISVNFLSSSSRVPFHQDVSLFKRKTHFSKDVLRHHVREIMLLMTMMMKILYILSCSVLDPDKKKSQNNLSLSPQSSTEREFLSLPYFTDQETVPERECHFPLVPQTGRDVAGPRGHVGFTSKSFISSVLNLKSHRWTDTYRPRIMDFFSKRCI